MLDILRKRPNEQRDYIFVFWKLPEIINGETISSVHNVRATEVGLVLTAPAQALIVDLTDPATGIKYPSSGVVVNISAGNVGTLYHVFVDVITSGNHTLTCGGILHVGDIA